MLKVVLDANVFVSALINPHGKPAQILDHALENKIRVFVSSPIIEEFERVLRYPKLMDRHGLEEGEIGEFIYDLLNAAALTEEGNATGVIKGDPSDDKYLSCVVAAKADFIVSGDEHLLSLREYRRIPIVTSSKFLEILEEEMSGD